MSRGLFNGIHFHFTNDLANHGCQDLFISHGAPPEWREAVQAMLRKALAMGGHIYFAFHEDQWFDEEDDEDDG